MKRMIISPAQLKMINEAVATYDGTVPGLNKAVANFKATGNNTGGSVSFVNENPPLDAQNNAFTGDINVASGSNTVTMTSNDINKLEESRYSKRQVELGRILEMRRTGKVFSKKQLNEMFMETQENADRIRQGIGGCKLHDIFDAIEEFFPEEVDGVKEAFMNGADLPEYICSIFSNDDINGEKEDAFLERLGI